MASATAFSLRDMQRPSWRSPVRWGLIAGAVLLGLVTALAGPWAVTVAMALLVAWLLVGLAHDRRQEVKRESRSDP